MGGIKVFYQQLLTFGVVLADFAVLWFLLMKTRLGLAIRSTAEDREVANLMGMNESRLAMITMGISVGLAGLTGAVIVPLFVLPLMWMEPLIIDDGRRGPGGIWAASRGVLWPPISWGLPRPWWFFWSPRGLSERIFALSIMILVLLIRPEGLLVLPLRKRGKKAWVLLGFYLRKFFDAPARRGAGPPSRTIVGPFRSRSVGSCR